jgi:hypothetical protein
MKHNAIAGSSLAPRLAMTLTFRSANSEEPAENPRTQSGQFTSFAF